MAVLQMQRVNICAMKRDRKKILELLQRREALEVSEPSIQQDGVFTRDDTSTSRKIFEKGEATASQALEILDRYVPEKKPFLNMLRGRAPVSVKENDEFYLRQEDILQNAGRIVQLERIIAESKSEILKLENQEHALEPWLSLPMAMSFKGTKKTTVFIGSVDGEKTMEQLLLQIAQASPEIGPVHFELVSGTKEQTCFYVICLKQDASALGDALRQVGFTRPPSGTHYHPNEKRQRLEQARQKELQKVEDSITEIKSYQNLREDLKFLQDHLAMRQEKYGVIENLSQSRHVFVLEGYIPEQDGPKLQNELVEKFDCTVDLTLPAEDEDVPVKLKNNRFSEPAESIVESYSLPGKEDVDPTGVMAFFYYAMFGIMFGDAGYGFIMALVCGILLLRFKNMEPNWNRNIRMFFWCGVFTVIAGVLFSSYFGDAVNVISRTFFGHEVSIPPLLFYINNDSAMLMLVISLGIGIVHLTMGYIMKAVTCVKNGDLPGVIYETVFPILSWYPLVVILVSSDMFANLVGFKVDTSPLVTNICLGVAGGAIVGILFTSGRESKSWLIRILKGFYGVYSVVSGWLSDTLSYSRLLALALASGVIASVMNQLGSMGGNNVVGIILFIVVFILGQTMNFGINVLGAYVHSNRLEYIEFFGKFYEGGGRKFTPFGIHTKYFKIEEDN